MYGFLGILSIVGFLVCVVLLVMAKVKKNGKVKKWAMGAGACFVIFVIALAISPGLTPEQIAQRNQAKELKVKQAAEIVEKTKADAIVADAKAAVDAEAKAKQDAADKVIADAKAIEDKKIADAAAATAAAAAVEAAKPKYIAYKELARNPDNYVGTNVIFTGQVIQVQESGNTVNLRVNVTKNTYGYEDTLLIQYDKSIVSGRVLDDDIITFSGMSMGLLTYKTVMGSEMTIPQVLAKVVEVN